jgi:Wzt C-terminal domain
LGTFFDAAQANPTNLDNVSVTDDFLPIQASFRNGSGEVLFEGIRMTNAHGVYSKDFAFKEWMFLDLLITSSVDIESCYPGMLVKDLYGNYLVGVTSWSLGKAMPLICTGDKWIVRFSIQLLFRPGSYSILINNATDNLGTGFYDWCDNVIQFSISNGDYLQPAYGYGIFGPPMSVEIEKAIQ